MTDRYAVFGHPIGHSKSPLIHRLFAEQTGQDLCYAPRDVDLPAFESALQSFFGCEGGAGINCTLPLKEAAFRVADARSARAERAGAVNTLMARADGTLFGDNTDGVGLLRDLTLNHAVALQGARILILGAGGAARGILAPLLEAGPEHVVIANRTETRACSLTSDFADQGRVRGCGFDALVGQEFDLVINATAASLSGSLPPLPDGLVSRAGCCYDLAYGSVETSFVRWGRANGALIAIDGLGMLVEQAAEAFALWRSVRPETRPVIERLARDRGF